MDRAEEWGHCAKAPGLPALRGPCGRSGDQRLYGASRLFVNFFQPSFKLAAKHRDGAKVTKRYHPPQTPCERLLASEHIPMAAKGKLQEISANLDPLKLLAEMRALQAYLTAMADGETLPPMTSEPPNLAAFVASLSSAWHQGEIRPPFSIEAKPRYLRGLQRVSEQARITDLVPATITELRQLSARHEARRRRGRSRPTPSGVMLAFRGFAWSGQSYAGGSRASRISTRRSSSTSRVSSSRGDLLAGSTSRSCDASTSGAKTLVRAESSSARRSTDG